jgi:aminoglycoside phosphotransferase (APT) family kinase protein
VAHGDFAPWNIKVHPSTGAWQVFDWERGELRGVPAWDWLHFEIQTAILVHRESVAKLLGRIARLFGSPEFRAYAAKAGIAGLERAMLTAYLLHCVNIQPQTEGLAEIEALLQAV